MLYYRTDIGITIVSERDLTASPASGVVTCTHSNGFLKCDLPLKYQNLSLLFYFLSSSLCLSAVQGKVRLWEVREKSACSSG